MSDSPTQNWTEPEWLAEVGRWVGAVLARQGIRVAGPAAQLHAGGGSTVLRLPTEVGDVYFKAVASVFGHETAVTQFLFRLRPDCIPQVYQIDAQRGWMLMADGGQTARMAFANEAKLERWRDILTDYAHLQIDLAEHVDDFLALGSPDRRLHLLPALYEDLVTDTDWLFIDQPDGVTTAEHERLLATIPQVADMCRRLDAFAVPHSLHHNDLHDANIFVKDGRYLFFDWGDSSIAHPFFSLRTVFVSIEYTFGFEENDPIFDELAKVYLQPWTQFETAENVWQAYQIAKKLWALSTAVKYKTQVSQIEEMREEYGTAVAGLLQEFLEAQNYGDAEE